METFAQMAQRIGRDAQATEFGGTFRVGPHGSFAHGSSHYAPEVFHSDTDDVEIMGEGWEPLTGLTGQHGYRGAVMHASEYIGQGIGAHLLELAQDSGEVETFALVTVEVLPEDDDPEPEPAGWAILRYVG